jgi:predicted nucleic acid-binding protein
MPETEELVINTGPLLALIAGIGDLSLLELLYKRVLVPFEVCQEIEAVRNALDLGEASVIQLALNENIHTVCIDEPMGRRIARLNGLKLTGSIGVLIRAKQDGFDFSMREAINRMQSQGIYLSQKVVDFALKQVNELNR